jgi:hypothetical protein
VEPGQSFYRAARWVDKTHYDVEALAREGNLAVLPFDSLSREIVARLVEDDASDLLDGLLAEYVSEQEDAE